MIVILALSLISLPIFADPAQAADPPSLAPPAPPAKAVALLERLRTGNARPRPNQQLAAQAKPGLNAKQAKQAKPGKKAKPGKGKKKARAQRINRKGCIFEVRKRTWTLVRKCTPKGTIVIPNGYTLNGKNRVMVVTGNAAKFDGAVVVSGFGRANIRNLRILGNAGLTGQCSDLSGGVFFYHSSGTISNVTVRNTEPAPACASNGIYASGDKRVNVLSSTVQNAGNYGIAMSSTINGTVAGNDILIATRAVSGFARGIFLGSTTGMVVRNNLLRLAGDDTTLGIRGSGNAGLVITGNQIQNLDEGIDVSGFVGDPSNVLITGNHLVGIVGDGIVVVHVAAQITANTVGGVSPFSGGRGIELNPTSSGLADDNQVTSFTCGIEDNSAIVVGGGNTYQNNFVNTC